MLDGELRSPNFNVRSADCGQFINTYGWTAMRCQSESRTVKKAFSKGYSKCKGPDGAKLHVAIAQRAGLLNKDLDSKDDGHLTIPNDLWRNVLDGESSEGPVNAPWRIFTAWTRSEFVLKQFKAAETTKSLGDVVPDSEKPLKAYPEWKDLDSKIWTSIIVAVVFGVAIQIGSTGPAMILMFLFPPRVSAGCLRVITLTS